jgi:exoribonuclease-2
MNVLFEDDGQLKAGTLLADHDASVHVEAVSGKRQKIKASHVLLRFSQPSPAETMSRAHQLVEELDPNFLWEVVPDDEFGFDDLAREYYGDEPAPAQAAAVALALSRAPMYFYRKGRGRFRRAPPDALKAALASIARKEREARDVAQWSAELRERRLPQALAAKLDMLLYRPDKQSPEWKALQAACETLRIAPVQLLRECGAIASTHDYHFRRFVQEAFPQGTAFPAWGALPDVPGDLPRADVAAFSIDDASTTEIDDAFSVRALADGSHEIGIHIACPAIAIPRGTPLDAIARAAVDGLHARAQAHDAARRDRRSLYARSIARAAGVVALRHYRCRRQADRPAHDDRARAGRCELAARRGRRGVRRAACRERAAVDRRASRLVGARVAPRCCA